MIGLFMKKFKNTFFKFKNLSLKMFREVRTQK
jgi:hypothetical protein